MPNFRESDISVFADRIVVIKNVLTQVEADYIIDMHKNMDNLLTTENSELVHKLGPWRTSSEDPYIYGTKREAVNWNGSRERTKNPKVVEYYDYISGIFDQAGRIYFEIIGMEYDPTYYTDFGTFHYVTGKSMGPHVDNDYVGEIDPIATGLLYLNSDKIGGDLYFKDQDVLVKSEMGTLVIFPCVRPFFHESTEITQGEKYHVGTGWKRSVSQQGK